MDKELTQGPRRPSSRAVGREVLGIKYVFGAEGGTGKHGAGLSRFTTSAGQRRDAASMRLKQDAALRATLAAEVLLHTRSQNLLTSTWI
eukprot:jgi/Bigna1/144828/aug1.91_g19536